MIFLSLIYLSFVSLGLPDSLLGSSWPLIVADLGVPFANAGFVSVTVSMGTVLSSLFSHKLIKRYGTGKVTLISVMMTAVALLGVSQSPSFIWLIVCAVPLGLGAGAVDSGLNEFVAEHYKAHHMSWLHCFWGVGAMLGPILISWLARMSYNWRSAFFTVSVVQFVVVILLFISLPVWKKIEALPRRAHVSQGDSGSKIGIMSAFRVKGVAWALASFFLYTAVENSMMLWGASYLVNAKGIAAEYAAGWVSIFFLGITLGRFVAGVVSFRLSNERMIRIGAALAILGLAVMVLPITPVFTFVAFILVGVGLAPIFPSLLHQTPIYFGSLNAQAIMGLQMAFAYVGVTLMPPLFGQLFSSVSFALMPIVLLVCAMCMLFCIIRLSHVAGNAQQINASNEQNH